MAGYVYPDNGSILDQPLILLEAFNVLAGALAAVKEGDGTTAVG